jgi:hypothetical protein
MSFRHVDIEQDGIQTDHQSIVPASGNSAGSPEDFFALRCELLMSLQRAPDIQSFDHVGYQLPILVVPPRQQ